MPEITEEYPVSPAVCQVENYTNLSGYIMSQPPEKKTAMSALDQLKKQTVVVADSGDIKGKTDVQIWASM